jgi:branched-chain amino acid transport system substrate-binding protein
VQDFVAAYEEKYGAAPDALAALAYDAANILMQAIEESGSAEPADIAETMETMDFSVVSGNIAYDEQHNPIKSAVILQVKDGAITFMDTVAP